MPEGSFAKGKNDPRVRTTLKRALQVLHQAIQQEWP
jgi:hypothetical protein